MTTTTAGETFRREFLAEFELDGPVDDLRLDAVCDALDLVEELEARVEEDGLTLRNPRGATVAHPLLAEIRRQRALLPKLLDALSPGGAETPSQKAARAARARWGRS